LQVLHRVPDSRVHIVAKTLSLVPSDCGLGLMPRTTFDACPQLDLICVPGGNGVLTAMQDPDTVAFVKRQAETAKYVTSVCTGAFILGTAGLLRGRRATTHWAYTGLLDRVGAIYEPGRVVQDGNVITAGGVTSGIDFALTIVAVLAGEDVAQSIQLTIEYDPAPPFRAGNPATAPTEIRSRVEAIFATRRPPYEAALAG
jgi:cyclohexyl-isocyanide hydratase